MGRTKVKEQLPKEELTTSRSRVRTSTQNKKKQTNQAKNHIVKKNKSRSKSLPKKSNTTKKQVKSYKNDSEEEEVKINQRGRSKSTTRKASIKVKKSSQLKNKNLKSKTTSQLAPSSTSKAKRTASRDPQDIEEDKDSIPQSTPYKKRKQLSSVEPQVYEDDQDNEEINSMQDEEEDSKACKKKVLRMKEVSAITPDEKEYGTEYRVDDYFNVKYCSLFQQNDIIYSAKLYNSDNKFAIIQILKSNTKADIYYLWNRWGKEGTKGQNSIKEFTDPKKAIKEFTKKKSDKISKGNYHEVEETVKSTSSSIEKSTKQTNKQKSSKKNKDVSLFKVVKVRSGSGKLERVSKFRMVHGRLCIFVHYAKNYNSHEYGAELFSVPDLKKLYEVQYNHKVYDITPEGQIISSRDKFGAKQINLLTIDKKFRNSKQKEISIPEANRKKWTMCYIEGKEYLVGAGGQIVVIWNPKSDKYKQHTLPYECYQICYCKVNEVYLILCATRVLMYKLADEDSSFDLIQEIDLELNEGLGSYYATEYPESIDYYAELRNSTLVVYLSCNEGETKQVFVYSISRNGIEQKLNQTLSAYDQSIEVIWLQQNAYCHCSNSTGCKIVEQVNLSTGESQLIENSEGYHCDLYGEYILFDKWGEELHLMPLQIEEK